MEEKQQEEIEEPIKKRKRVVPPTPAEIFPEDQIKKMKKKELSKYCLGYGIKLSYIGVDDKNQKKSRSKTVEELKVELIAHQIKIKSKEHSGEIYIPIENETYN